jgi:hypothetical protein
MINIIELPKNVRESIYEGFADAGFLLFEIPIALFIEDSFDKGNAEYYVGK